MKLILLKIWSICLLIGFFSEFSYTQKVEILFLGNSLTYSNNLPEMVSKIGKVYGLKIKAQCLCYPNYALEDHWNTQPLEKILAKGKFSFVIMQQGPSSQFAGKTSLMEYVGKISQLAKNYNTQPALFMVWPSVQYSYTFEGVINNYTMAAEVNDILLLPVGRLWKAYLQNRPPKTLYQTDLFHPNTNGSFLAALIIFQHLFPKYSIRELEFKKLKNYLKSENEFEALIRFLTT